MDAEDVARLQEKIETHKRRLHELELQAARFGIHCPPHIKIEIEDIQEQIFQIERRIDKNVIKSYIEGRETLKGVAYSLDGLEHNLKKVVLEEQRIYRIFGLPILTISRVVSQVLLAAFIVLFVGATAALLNRIATSSRQQEVTAQAVREQTAMAQAAATVQMQTQTAGTLAIMQTQTALAVQTQTAGTLAIMQMQTAQAQQAALTAQAAQAQQTALTAQTAQAQQAAQAAIATQTALVVHNLLPSPQRIATPPPPTDTPAP
jgi:hypothetical protein